MSGPQGHNYSVQLGECEITFETGRLAQQAGGSVIARAGDTMLLVTATASKHSREGLNFLPLSVEFEEKLYAAGRIPGSFFRREGRPSEDAVLICRLVDRPLRPLFNKKMRNEVQVIITTISSDGEKHLDILAVNGASAAMAISDIPWNGPVGAVRVGLIDDELIVNPNIAQTGNSTLDLRVAGTKDAIMMVEAGAEEVPEDIMLKALKLAHEEIIKVVEVIQRMRDEVGKAKREVTIADNDPETVAAAEAWLEGKITPVLEFEGAKAEKGDKTEALREELLAAFADDESKAPNDLTETLYAPLQLSPLLRRRNRPRGWNQTPRSGSRRIGRARAHPRTPQRSRFPLHPAHCL